MKATIKFKEEGRMKQKTMEVQQNEPNSIVREFIKATKKNKFTFITTIKCGLTIYEWNGTAVDALLEERRGII